MLAVIVVRARHRKGLQATSPEPKRRIPLKEQLQHLRQQIHRMFRVLRVAVRRNKKTPPQMLLLVYLSVIIVGLVIAEFSSSLSGPALGVIILLARGGITEIVTDGWFHELYVGFTRAARGLKRKDGLASSAPDSGILARGWESYSPFLQTGSLSSNCCSWLPC